MKIRMLCALLCALAMGSAKADLADDLIKAADSVKRLRTQWTQGTLPSAINLDDEVAALTRMIADGKLNEAGLAVAHYYRADANLLANETRVRNNLQLDVAAARTALADYDRIIARGKDIADWGVDVSNAGYSAGWIAAYHLASMPLAYGYWEKCAELFHAGCMSTIAAAKVTGAGGMKIDIPQAMYWNAKVYSAGTGYGCAGAYSARDNSLILHFMVPNHRPQEEIEWLNRGRGLLDELAVKEKSSNPCNRTRFDVFEYLMRLSQGDERKPLLKSALERAQAEEDKATARYLSGTIDDDAFRAVAAKALSKPAQCSMHFVAMWSAEINRNAALSREHLRSMRDLGQEFCATELAYVKKYQR